MRISFIVPPPLDGKKPAERSAGCTRLVYHMPNIYELTVAALFEKMNHQVEYHDFVISNKTKKNFRAFLNQHQTDIYCIWSVNLSIETDCKTIEIIHNLYPDRWVVMMGPAPTYFPGRYLTNKQVLIVRGEPENSAASLLNAIQNKKQFTKINGISFINAEGKIIKTPACELIKDLDTLPFPARHLTKDVVYRNPKLKHSPYTSVVTSRNCPYKCIYCVPSSLTFARELESKSINGKKPPVSVRSVANIDSELAFLAQEGYRSIAFLDDNFIWDPERLKGIVESLKKHRFHWGCQARADAITPEVAEIIANSGCDYIDLGVESFNDDILKFIKKGMSEARIMEGIELLNKFNIPVKLNILIGSSPLETKETIRDSIRKTKKLKVSQVMFNIVSPFPGTEFYDMAVDNGWIKGGQYYPTDVQQESILEYTHISAKQMEGILFRSNLSFFLRPSIILRHMRQFRSMGDFSSALKAFKIKMFG